MILARRPSRLHSRQRGGLRGSAALAGMALLLSACAVPIDPGAAVARSQLDQLKQEHDLALIPEALQNAEAAVAAAEQKQESARMAEHHAWMAQRQVELAQAKLAWARDRQAAAELQTRRDTIKHGNDSIVTLAGDAFGATPQTLRLQPIGKDSPLPPAGDTPTPTPPVPVPVVRPPPVLALAPPPPIVEHDPLLDLGDRSFRNDGHLQSGARLALDGLLPTLARHPGGGLQIRYSAQKRGAQARADEVRNYLLSKGVPNWLLSIGASSDTATQASGLSVALQGHVEIPR